MKTTTRFDYPALPSNSIFTVRLMLALSGGTAMGSHKSPLNIAMVIDRSGSMRREKIAKVKEAASMIAHMLAPHDIFSLVAFNDTAETIVPVAKGADLAGVEGLIAKINAAGNTNLFSGYDMGYQLASQAAGIATSRIVLLSDGLANRGIKTQRELSSVSGKMRDCGITTTTFGVGHDFDETLMTMMAEEGGGSANFIEHPWQAAEVFREELEDLRNISATNARVSFTPGSCVSSYTLLNSYPDKGGNSWLIGDIYSTRERRVVLELEVRTVAETADLNIGLFEVYYDNPGKSPSTPLKSPVSIPVVSSQEFDSCTVDNEVTLEAALLSLGRAKRNALKLSCQQKFIEAADLLDSYVSAIAGLCLNVPELDRELELLKERSWNLRHRGKEFFTATEKKYFTYEADLSTKGKKEKYNAMMARRSPEQPSARNNAIAVTSLINDASSTFMVGCSANRSVSGFLEEIYNKLNGAVEPGTYGRLWVLRDEATSRIFDLGSSYARAQGCQEDRRTLEEVKLTSGVRLEAIPLPALPNNRHQKVPPEVVRVDLSHLRQAGSRSYDVICRAGSIIACDFLAEIYAEIKESVPPNSYGRTWLLRDSTTGRVFDFGTSWARFHQLQADIRPIEKVGVNSGSLLDAILISQRSRPNRVWQKEVTP